MKVSDVMSRHVEFVTSDTKVLDVARIIFGRRINGLPVCKGKKVVGFITETDILSKLHPTMQEFAEDPLSSVNFESMEGKVREVLELTAKDITSKTPTVVNANDPLLKADSIMRVKDVGRLPVVDDRENLVGIISMGDIFKSIVGKKMPYLESEEYHDWISRHFDMAMGWESRLTAEIPPLVDLFKKNNVKKILDIGCGTGGHAIELAKNGFEVVGLENSQLMFKVAQDKWSKLAKSLKKKVKFLKGDYIDLLSNIHNHYEAAIFMGSALSHIPYKYMQVLDKLESILSKKNACIVLQLSNHEKAIDYNNGLRRFTVKQSRLSPEWKHAYLWFYDSSYDTKGDPLMLNAAIFDFDGSVWTIRGINRVATIPFSIKDLQSIFNRFNFPKVSFYGSEGFKPLFVDKFKPDKSEWLNVVARR
ncbi:MAG: CBS domain-containing protein [Candidatus Levybacteria bacterium]|nr:CBS domain-containing protein [Candidatus Levybacteria bacterium]